MKDLRRFKDRKTTKEMNMQYKEILMDANKEAIEVLQNQGLSVNIILDEYQDRLRRNTLENIPLQFGTFLYTALGDNVNSTLKSVINKKYFETDTWAKSIADSAKNANMELADYLKANNNGKFSGLYAYLSTGRKFGITYYTNRNTHTMYMSPQSCFKYLQQEHVDCICNKEKRKCAQGFLDFRNEYVDTVNNLNHKLIPTPIDITMVKVYNTNIKSKFGDRYDSRNNYIMLDKPTYKTITHTEVHIDEIDVWDCAKPSKCEVKGNSAKNIAHIDMTFVNINDDKKEISRICNADIDMENTNHTYKNIDYAQDVMQKGKYASTYYNIGDNPVYNSRSYHSIKSDDSLILNMDEVLKNPTVQSILEERIKFYGDMSIKLQELKHANATLYFLNADI